MVIERGMVAVITGGASGIGQAVAAEFVRRHLQVVLVDVDASRLESTRRSLGGETAEVTTVCADLSQDSCVQQLRSEIEGTVGPPHVLCNNAGVYTAGGPIWSTLAVDWQWTWQVNVMGVVRSLQALIPGMLSRGGPAHIVNMSSIMGLASGSTSVYGTSKHAVARITEGLYHDLVAARAPIGVSLVCPGPVATQLMLCDRNRPDQFARTALTAAQMAEQEAKHRYFETHGLSPSLVASAVAGAIERDQFFVFPGADARPHLEARLTDIREGRAPTLVPLTAPPEGL